MQKKITELNPDLVIGTTAAIERMGAIASCAAEQKKPNFPKQIQLVRRYAKSLCPSYSNCRVEDWCFMCASGQEGTSLFLGETCLSCKLLVVDSPARARESKLIRIGVWDTNTDNQSQS